MREVPVPTGSAAVQISVLDLAIIVAYLAGIVALGCWAWMRRRGAKGSDYFLAGKSLTWVMIGLALFATNISTIHLVSFAQNGFTSGLTYGNYEWMAAFTLVILALFFAPFYLRSGVATLPDFMERRYSPGTRNYLAVLSILSAIMVHIGFSLHTGAIVLEGTILPAFVADPSGPWIHFGTILGLCVVTAIYTIVGGLLAVVLTESLQTLVMLAGSICITLIGLHKLGGWSGLVESVHPVNLSILRPSTDPTGVTWYAVFLGYPVLGVWYWCTDQTIVQRVLGARDENHARLGPLFAGFIKILPVFLFVLPGIVALGLVRRGIIPPLPCNADGSPATDHTYTHLLKTILWPGMRGVVIAAMLAALMSTVAGALNSIATLFSYDIYKRWWPEVGDRRLIWIGRVATAVAMLVAVGWSMVLARSKTTIFQAMVDVFPGLAPPTAVVFLWGVFWRRASATGAFWTLIAGSGVGLGISAAKIFTEDGRMLADPNSLLAQFLGINSLFMAFLLFLAESVFLVVVSLLFPHEHTSQSESLVWKSPWDALQRQPNSWRGLLDFRVMAGLLVVTMVALYIGFSDFTVYHPFGGKITLDGQPVIGAVVYLDTERDVLDAELVVGADGRYQFGSKQQAGGAPEGTRYRLRIEPRWDYIVLVGDAGTGQTETVLAAVPAGAPIRELTGPEGRTFVVEWPQQRMIRVGPLEHVEIRRATPVPERLRHFETSGVEIIAPGPAGVVDISLRSAG